MEVGMQGGAIGALDAVIGPQHLIFAVQRDHLERGPTVVGTRKGDVSGRMPVLGSDRVRKQLRVEQLVDTGQDVGAVCDWQLAAWHEIRLDVGQQKDCSCQIGQDSLPLLPAAPRSG